MQRILRALVFSVGAAAAAALAAAVPAAQAPASAVERVDKVFSRWTGDTPGCAVGVGVKGRPALEKAYGMADLEHAIANKPDTIFEAGSVSKQFTAAAVLLLAREGKLSLDDPARKYVPELPDYGAPLTLRHMLQHVSGLRDWGEVAALGGWPRTSRVHTHAHVLDIVSRQRSLNFPSGTRYSYSNTGYNLAAVIVSRVSGKSFAEFSRERIFQPLGMTRTSWRDDYTRIVKDRAIAYTDRGGQFSQNMPFENVHGNGGLLTTVGDLLRWSENAVSQKIGDAEFLRIQHEPGRFNDGTAHTYAMGLTIGSYKGVKEVSHSGSTAGYRAHLVRFPDQHVSVAVLCNVTSGAATPAAEAVADVYLGDSIKAGEPGGRGAGGPGGRGASKPAPLTAEQLVAYVGSYASDEAEATYTIAVDGSTLVLKRRPDTTIRLTATGVDTFTASVGGIRFIRDAAGRVTELSVAGSRVFDMRFRRQ
jgi:CubicO group peptidase (beta-lactamase class C family)